MKIFIECDDGEVKFHCNGGARAFRATVKKCGRGDNLVVGYHKGKAVLFGSTSTFRYGKVVWNLGGRGEIVTEWETTHRIHRVL
jgi:hypothetical protein